MKAKQIDRRGQTVRYAGRAWRVAYTLLVRGRSVHVIPCARFVVGAAFLYVSESQIGI